MHSSVKESHSVVSDLWPMDSRVHGILQARILEWVAFPFSRESSQTRDQTQTSHIAGRYFTSWDMRENPTVLVLKWCPNNQGMRVWVERKNLSGFSSLHAVRVASKFLSNLTLHEWNVSLTKHLTEACWVQRMDCSQKHTCGLCKVGLKF